MAHIENKPFSISLENDLVIKGNVHAAQQDGKKPLVIICHGFKGYKDWNFFPYLADKLAEDGYYTIRFDFSCNGVNERDFDELDKFAVNTYSRELADLEVLLENIQERNLPYSADFDLDRIGILGHSRGGADSILFASEQLQVKAVVTWNGVSEVDFWNEELKEEIYNNGVGFIENKRTNQMMPMKPDVLEDIKKNEERLNILAALESMQTPVHIIQGDADGDWLVNGAYRMEKAAPHHTLSIIEGGDHTFHSAHPLSEVSPPLKQAIHETTEFFKQTLK